jgi:hypothetical protein
MDLLSYLSYFKFVSVYSETIQTLLLHFQVGLFLNLTRFLVVHISKNKVVMRDMLLSRQAKKTDGVHKTQVGLYLNIKFSPNVEQVLQRH